MLNIDGNTDVATGTTIINGTGTLRFTGGTFAASGASKAITMSLGSGSLIDVQSGANMRNGGWQDITWTDNLADLNVDGTFDPWDGNTVIVDALTGSGTVNKSTFSLGLITLSVGADNGSGTFSGVIQNSNAANFPLALTKTGTGTQVLSGANTYTGATTISAGTLSIGAGGTTGSISNSSAVTDNATLIFNRSNAYTYTGTISGNGAVIKNGTGTTTLSGTNTYNGAGGTTVNAGVLQAGSAQCLGNVANAITVNNGGAIDLAGYDLRGYTSNITINGQLDANNGAIINSGAWSTTQGLVREITLGSDAYIGNNGHRIDIGRGYTGAVRVTGNNHTLYKIGTDTIGFLGQATTLTALVINGGYVQFEDNASFGTAPITVNSGVFLLSWDARSITNAITMSSGNINAEGAGGSTFGGTMSLTGTNYFGNSGGYAGNSFTISGAISGTGALTKQGTGILTLSSTSNAYAGNTTVSSGTLKLGNTQVIPDASAMTVNGTLEMNAFSETIGSLAGSGTVDNNAGAATYTLTTGGDNSSTIFSGIIKNTLSTVALTKTGSGTMILSGSNTYTGVTTVSGGTLQIGNAGTSGSFSNSGNITNSATVAFNRSDAYTYSGVISSTGAVRVDAGVVTLSSATGNTYSGGTTISSGTLMVTNTSGSGTGTGSVTVNSGGTLSGTGIVSGAVTVNSGGAIQPTLVGASGGTLTLSSGTDPVFNATTTLTIRTPSSTVDKVSLTGGGAAFTASNVALNIDATGLTGEVTGATIVQVTKGNGIVGGFASVTANNNYNVTVHYASKAITIDLEPGKYFAGTGTWNTTNTNWSPFPGGPYVFKFNGGNDAIFESPAGTVTVSSPNNPLSMTFLVDGYTLTSGTITLAGPTITAGAGINAAINSVIAGSVGLSKVGAGGLSLGGTNTFIGGVTLSAGTLNINSASALGDPSGTFTITGGTINNTSGGAVTVSGNNPQAWNGSFTFSGSSALTLGTGAVTLGASPTVTVSAGTLTSGGVISGSYGLTKAGTGTLALSGANTFTGGLTVSAGTLKLGAAGVIPDGPTAGKVSVTGTLDLNSFSETINGLSGAGTVDNTAAGTPTLTVGNDGADAVGGTFIGLAEGATLTADFGGTMYPFTISYLGTAGGDNDVVLTALAVGTLKNWTGGAAGNNWSNGGGYTANWSPAQIPISGDIVVFSSAATTKRTTGTTDIASLTISLAISNISAACAIASGGSQPFTLNSSGINMSTATANDFTINQAFSLGASQIFNVTTSGRTLNLNAAITNGAFNLTITGAGNVTTSASGVLGPGAGGLTMSGSGTLTLAASNTYTGVTTFNSGTISGNSFANGGTVCAFGQTSNSAASFVFNGGPLTYTGSAATPDRSFTLCQSGGVINSSGTGALSLGTGAPALAYSGSGTRNLTIGGTYTGADNGGATSLTKNGTGTWIINQANTYTGATTITLGTLKCGAASVISSSSQVSISTSASTVFTSTTITRASDRSPAADQGAATFRSEARYSP